MDFPCPVFIVGIVFDGDTPYIGRDNPVNFFIGERGEGIVNAILAIDHSLNRDHNAVTVAELVLDKVPFLVNELRTCCRAENCLDDGLASILAAFVDFRDQKVGTVSTAVHARGDVNFVVLD